MINQLEFVDPNVELDAEFSPAVIALRPLPMKVAKVLVEGVS